MQLLPWWVTGHGPRVGLDGYSFRRASDWCELSWGETFVWCDIADEWLSAWRLRGLAEGQTQMKPARQAEHAPSNIFRPVTAVCVILNPGTKGTHYSVHEKKKSHKIQPLKYCECLFVSFPPAALCLSIKQVCLLGAGFAYISGFPSVCHFIGSPSVSLTNSWWHWETPRHLTFHHQSSPYFF